MKILNFLIFRCKKIDDNALQSLGEGLTMLKFLHDFKITLTRFP